MENETMDPTREDETAQEEAIQEYSGATPDEAHRIGEFDDVISRIEHLTDMLSALTATVDGISERMGTYQSVSVDNGADVSDMDGDGDIDGADTFMAEAVEIPDVSDMDFTIK